jgi:PAS domain-containing protein
MLRAESQPLTPLEADALEAHPDFVVLGRVEPDTQELIVDYANLEALRMLGRSAGEVVGKSMRSLLVSDGAFVDRASRANFFAQLRAHGRLELPDFMTLPEGPIGRRMLRLRFVWPRDGARILLVAEDVTDRNSSDAQNNARARLRSAMDVSQLFSHHINNALASALLNVELTISQLDNRLSAELGAEVFEELQAVTNSIRTATQVVGALAATTRMETEAAQSADLLAVLKSALSQTQPGPSRRLRASLPEGPCWVWGSAEQLHMILMGFLPLLRAEAQDELSVFVEILPAEQQVRLSIAALGSGDAWLRPLLDPSSAHAGTGSDPVRLFASTQVLHAIGGRLGLPRVGKRALGIELTFRAAPGAIEPAQVLAPCLLVSPDRTIRMLLAAELAPRSVEFTDSVREGIVRAMRPDGGIVVCDVDRIDVPLDELLSFIKAVVPRDARLLLASRDASVRPNTTLPVLPLPFTAAQLEAQLLD